MGATIGAIAELLGIPAPEGVGDVESMVVLDVTHDSREVAAGSLFVAVRGSLHDGHDHVAGAADRGAIAAMVVRPVDHPIVQLVVDDTRAAMAPVARLVHGSPDTGMSILGVTGTNGKTTVTHLCEAAWRAEGRPCGVVGTLGARYENIPIPLARTTPESSDTQRILARMRSHGVRSVAMEVSSHALELHRADAITFTAVGFTNLTQDHLDFHGSMQAYLDAKLRLFVSSRAPVAVVDTDSPVGRVVAEASDQRVVRVGFDSTADITASDVWTTPTGSEFTMHIRGDRRRMMLPLAGSFNISNALVAAGLLLEDHVEPSVIAEGFATIDAIPGRMEVVVNDGPFTVIVDYAHTPDAIDTVLASVRGTTEGRLIAVVGAGGDRDAAKRAPMGAATAAHADMTIVTTDNPRSEDPAAIAAQVVSGAERVVHGNVRTVLSREDAISEAIDMAGPGDVVMVLGKGHEQGQEIAGVTRPFDDREIARRALEASGWATS